MKLRRVSLLLGVSVLWVPLAFLSDGVTVLMLPLRLGGEATAIGLVSMAGLGMGALVQLLAGWASDRLRPRVDRRVFIALFAAPVLAGLWLFAGSPGILGAVVGYLLLQAAAAAMQAGQQSLIPEHVRDTSRGRASGFKAAFDVGGSFLAFLLLGVLLGSGHLAPAAAAIGGLLVVGVVLAVVLVPRSLEAPVARTSSISSSGGLPPGLLPLISSRFLFLFATYGVGRFLVILVADRVGATPEAAVEQAGGLLALFALLTAGAAIPFGWLADRRPGWALATGGALATSLGIMALVPAVGLGGVLVGGLLMSAGTAAFMTSNWAATTRLVPAPAAGRLLAVANLGTGLAAAAAGILGPLIDAVGFGPALLLAAVAAFASVIPLGIRPSIPANIREHAT